MLTIFNSLTKEKAPFESIEANHIRLYVCGNTVYDYAHIGHARGMLVFDSITRYLRAQGWRVTFVRNITDIDDKIIHRANEHNESWQAVTARFIAAQREDEHALGLVPPDHEPQATEYVPQIIALIERIIAAGHGYVSDDGDVYFDVRSFKAYGQLSHRDVDDLRSGARVAVGEAKRDPLDFVLWKSAKPDEPSWQSPWGAGRPGWHIECSAMSTSILGQPFDIHGGGLDLKFPHHENEITQSESVCEHGFANTWMHIGLLQINGEKMSKSLGNFVTIRDALQSHHPEVLRYFMLSSHYRSPLNYTASTLDQMRHGLERLYNALDGLMLDAEPSETYTARFHAAMEDDFNTPEAMAVLFELSREINRLKEQDEMDAAARLGAELKALAGTLGLLQVSPSAFLQGATTDVDVVRVEALLQAREQARAEKNWARADEIRDALTAMHITILDSKDGTTWRYTA